MRYRIISVWAVAVLCSLTTAVACAQTAAVDFGTTAQTIRGFGGSTGFQPALTSAEAATIFGTGSGQLGLSLLRVRIDDSTTTGGSNWAQSLSDAQLASAQGATVFASPWSPPAAWKSNGSTIQGSLLPADYAAYANYLNLFTAYMKAGGVNLYAISMQNEPDANVSYDSCVWTGAQMDTWIAQNASVLTTKLIMPESESFTTSYSDPALNDSAAVNYISIIGGHLYGASPSYYTNAENKGKEVWMTEHYLNPSTGFEPNMSDAISLAEEVHNSMTVGEYNAYVWWWIEDEPSENSYIGMVDTSDNTTFYGLALGQFAKYVRPGYVRVSATSSPSSGVYVSAYKGSGNYVIVAINSNSSATSVPFTIANQTITSFTPYQTTSTESMAELSAVSVSANAFTYSLPAQSITTFVGTGSSTPSFTISPSAATLSIAQGKTGTDTITVSDVNKFTGSVTLAATGLPSGVTAAFGTNPTTGTSVVTFTASATATAGTSTVTITGTSGTLSATTTIALTITGSGGCTPTAITPYLQVNGAAWQQTNVASVASGSTVNLGPQPLSGGTWAWAGPNGFTSTARQINGIALSTGANSYVATFTNTAACSSKETFTITVANGTTPSFTLASSASSLSVKQGGSGTDTVTITPAGGFTGTVTLAASGLPSGVSAAFATNPATGSSVVTFAASSTATVGTSTVTITGTSGSLTASTTIALTVSSGGTTTGNACHVVYAISPQNTTAFGASITIENTGSTSWSSWTLTWSFANGQTVSSLWNGNETQSGANVTVTNESYNGSIAAGASYAGVGFNGTWNGSTNAVPASFAVNGTTCN